MALKNKQAMKRHRQNLKRREQNKHVKSTVKSRIKLVLQNVEEKNIEGAQAALKDAQSLLDKAATKKVLHKKKASRKISRLSKKVKTLQQSAQ